MRYSLLISIGLCFLYPIESTLGPGDRKSSFKAAEKIAPLTESVSPSFKPSVRSIPQESLPPSELNVLQRDLLQEDLTARSVLENYGSYCFPCAENREFTYPTLIYITPWNNRGYDLIKIFPQKFDYVSPVWFSLKRVGNEKYLIEGTHDIDSKWIETIKEKRADIRFVPRMIVEKWSTDDIHALFQSENEKQQLALTLKKFLIEYNHLFDGYVLELLAQFGSSSKMNIHHILIDIADQIHQIETNTTRRKEVFLAVPPVEEYFNQEDLDVLSTHLDGFNIMTYDFPSKSSGPVSSIGRESFSVKKQELISSFLRMDQRNNESFSFSQSRKFTKNLSRNKFLWLSLRSNHPSTSKRSTTISRQTCSRSRLCRISQTILYHSRHFL